MRNGQVAMEFIMTYGWAIMVVLVMIGALAYFGVLNPGKYTPDRCLVTTGFSCGDYRLSKWDSSVSQSEVSFVLQNDLGESVTFPEKLLIKFKEEVGDANCGQFRAVGDTSSGTSPYTLPAGERVEVVCNTDTSASIHFSQVGRTDKITFEGNYTKVNGVYKHAIRGEVYANVQSQG